MKALSQGALATYERDGILFPIPVLSKEETARFRGAYNSFCEQLGARPNAAQSRNPHLFHRWAYDLATHARVLDAVEQIIGPNWSMAQTRMTRRSRASVFAVRYVAPSVRQCVAKVPTVLARGRDEQGYFESVPSPPVYSFDEAITAQAELVRRTTEARQRQATS